ncbi:unnamed protein product [Protopolystoma xenopodis]|uniref:Uncharacterized protein n=1 Tax=Protopolystoma xenopodis TaxID=117903 RepID=A0A3S5CSI3_9PLAT|nr:unnamed protein product [Protopolystoma xenopodis]
MLTFRLSPPTEILASSSYELDSVSLNPLERSQIREPVGSIMAPDDRKPGSSQPQRNERRVRPFLGEYAKGKSSKRKYVPDGKEISNDSIEGEKGNLNALNLRSWDHKEKRQLGTARRESTNASGPKGLRNRSERIKLVGVDVWPLSRTSESLKLTSSASRKSFFLNHLTTSAIIRGVRREERLLRKAAASSETEMSARVIQGGSEANEIENMENQEKAEEERMESVKNRIIQTSAPSNSKKRPLQPNRKHRVCLIRIGQQNPGK